MRDTLRIHAAYVIGILLATNILTFTVNWGSVPDLVGYVNFASTLTSLVLAILAIVYAYLSNASVAHQVLTLRTATDDMRGVAGALSEAATGLRSNVDALPKLFEEVGSKVTETHEFVHQLYEGADKHSANAAPEPAAVPPQVSSPVNVAKQFFNTASVMGLRATYMMYVAFTKKTAFDFNDAANKIGLDLDYAHGFLIASQACGMLAIKTKDSIWNVTRFDPEIGEGLKAALSRREDEFNKRWARGGRDRTMDRIEAYFNNTELPADDPRPEQPAQQA